jgi:hypothetical protein
MFRLLKYLPVIIPMVVKLSKNPRVKEAIAKARGPRRQP